MISVYRYWIILMFISLNISVAQVKYQVIDLGISALPSAINDSSQVSFWDGTQSSNFIWQNGELIPIGTLGDGWVDAMDINDSGKVVGLFYDNNTSNDRAFVSSNGNMSLLNVPGNIQNCAALGNNNSGTIVGWASADTGGSKAVKWQNGSMQYLTYGSVNSFNGQAHDVNSAGQIAGSYTNQNWESRGFVWYNGDLTEIGTLGGNITHAYAINNVGQVVGQTRTANNNGRAFLWQNGTLISIQSKQALNSCAWGLNDSGQVVGFQWINSRTAFLYEDGETKNLNDLIDPNSGWELTDAMAINNFGHIVGDGYYNGQRRAFLLKPIQYPILIVPGIAGTYSSNILFDLNWILNRGLPPENYQIDPLGKVYHDIIKTFENVGYKKDTTLFVVNYDWRLTPGPIDNNIDGKIDGLSGISITDNQFNYGVDYLGWYIKQASERWRELYDEDLDSIDVIAHSTGGLVTRTYIQSNAYGDVYNISENYKLPKIRNFVMIGVPNRGASKAWNPIHDNWIADPVYAFVLSKILNRAYQKIRFGFTIYGPDHNITYHSILNQGLPDLNLFIDMYVPTVRYLLATYNFLNLGGGFNNVNEDPEIRNTIVLDLNDGYDLSPNSSPNDFLDSSKVTVIYGTGKSTKVLVQKRNDFQLASVQSFTDWVPMPVFAGTDWYEDLETTNNGDGTVPIISSANQFSGDSRANLVPNSSGDHTGLVSNLQVQRDILNLLDQNFTDNDISTGSSASVVSVLSVISDPVELFISDGLGRRLGYSNSTGAVTEIPNSIWTGDTDGMGYVFDSVQESINLELTGLGEDYYVMVSVEDSGRYGGVVLEGFLAQGEVINYQIALNPLSVNELTLSPDNYSLSQNYPNPFNPVTTIQYSIPQRGIVTLTVYDILGKQVATLVNEEKDRGVYTVNFDASQLASGLYIYRLSAGSFVKSKKMLLLK